MTESEARALLVQTARKYLGAAEGGALHREIIDVYNGITPLPRSFKMTYSLAWCATFVSAMAKLCGMLDIIPAECSCGHQVALFQKLGRWTENDNYKPAPGDIIYYYWSDSGEGDCTGWPDHVGIVESVTGGLITVIEGNSSNAVRERTRVVGARYIRGYGLPNFAWWAEQHTEKPKDDPWYIKDGTWQEATRLGLFDGNRPTANITRAEAAVVALRVLKLAKEDK